MKYRNLPWMVGGMAVCSLGLITVENHGNITPFVRVATAGAVRIEGQIRVGLWNWVTRFSVAVPNKVERFKAGYSGSGQTQTDLAIGSAGEFA
jgi:hypothetical protein